MGSKSEEESYRDIKGRLRSILWRTSFLLILLGLGALLTYGQSLLNILNLFNREVSDLETVQRVEEQKAKDDNLEIMATVLIDGKALTLPAGFIPERFASGHSKLRMMAATDDGILLVSEQDRGNILGFDLKSGHSSVVISGLDIPSGLAFHAGAVWVAEHDRITKYEYRGQGKIGSSAVVVPNLPSGGNHVTRTIGFGPDGRLYVTVGSSCNVCEEKDKRRAALLRYNPDGGGEEILAEGLRNTVGFVWHPKTGEIWGVDNGRDLIGDDLPPEEINIIKPGKHYGWPYCYGRGVPNPEYRNRLEFCQSTEFPIVEMQAHSAPLGLRFYEGRDWSNRYDGNLFIAFHGSWNRTVPTGYKIVRVDQNLKVSDFITGWLDETTGKAWGRPVDILFADEVMYITDDGAGVIWKVTQK
jgi:glucose/arabinose dehydrogenase